MAIDDRERNFEKAMARELRSDALNGLHCPDAETLAAYHERLLSPEEMAAHKSHIASCERCQEILSTLEITETISAESDRAEKAIAASGPKALSQLHATPVFSKAAAAASESTPKVREMPKPKPYLRWAVPAGAIAAGLLVWVAIDHSWNQRKAEIQATKRIEIAENREQKEPQLTAPKIVEAPAPSVSQAIEKGDLDDKSKLGREYDGLASDSFGAAQGKLQTRSATNLPHGPRVLQNQVQNQMQNNANNIGNYNRQNEASDSAVGGALAKAVPSAPAVDALGRTEGALKAAPAPPPPAPASADAGARKDTGVAAAMEQVEAKTCWVLAEGGWVLRTVDGGKHWFKAATPVGVEFRSIVASDPLHSVISDASEQVKYVTSDGGATWTAAPR
ncbi:MAG: hypothetical protein NVS9B14_21700 [Candidatus Acidiferrum sp.]